jgi:predicted transglutaminase-like cysteine proteinase
MRLFASAVTITFTALLRGCATDIDTAPPAFSAADQSGLPVSTPLHDSDRAAAIPAGFVGFCLRFSDQCELSRNGPTTITLTVQSFAEISQINRTVNQQITPEDDSRHYGPAEYWTIPTDGYGDCEDYALTKRKALLQAGFPIGALRLALVITPERERHAILTLVTDRGDFVLDNLSDTVRPWTEASYTWLERQNPTKPWRWDVLTADNAGSSPTAATRKN